MAARLKDAAYLKYTEKTTDLMNAFQYRDNQLMVENVPLDEIAAQVGTPAYVYSRAAFTEPLDAFDEAFKDIPHLVCYAVKGAANLSLLKMVAEKNGGADIVSGGELQRSRLAGIAPNRVVFSGVGKTAHELTAALEADILMFNVESEAELALLSRVAAGLNKKARVSLRINPDVNPGTHPYIATGLKESKFGLALAPALALYKEAAADPNLEVVGVACHIGSQLMTAAPFLDAAEKLKALVLELAGLGIKLKYFDMGGGLGIRYSKEIPLRLADYAEGIKAILKDLPDITLILEPGRYISGNSAVLLAEVLYGKSNGEKNFVVVDAAMNDLIRPSLYEAYHEIRPVRLREGAPEIKVDVVGPICESSDFLAQNRVLPKLEPGDLIAVMSAGAYGYSMSSNYNARPRAAEVLVEGSTWRVIKPRETFEDLIRGEEI